MAKFGIILSLSYIIGLLLTNISSSPVQQFSSQEWTGFFFIVTILTTLITIFLPRFWYFSPPRNHLIMSGLMILIAVTYFQFRIPSPAINDISNQLNKYGNFKNLVEVKGEIISPPRLTRSDKIQFILNTNNLKLSSETNINVTGKLYVTVPLLQATGLYSSQKLTIIGKLYQPFSQSNAGVFDFKNYLLKQGIFAGLKGETVKIDQQSNIIETVLWQLRNRIIRSHLKYLKVPLGNLITSITIGKNNGNLNYQIQDSFSKLGLIHVLSVSGFQISLWLTFILFFTKNLPPQFQLIIGTFAILFYTLLTGFYPPILRASLMGIALLISMTNNRKINSLNSLILVATILLLINPLWIWDVGFQFSFLATLGLLILTKPIITGLDWLPPTIANFIAVPVAASVWILPLQSYIFNTIPLYSILVNIITNPLITIISLGSMISALFGIIFLPLGSITSWLLKYPTLFLLKIVELCSSLPFISINIGQISLISLLICYAIFFAIWKINWAKKRWQLMTLFLLTIIILPLFITKFNLNQVTVLANNQQATILIQAKGNHSLINYSNQENPDNFRYTLLPFLTYQGINKLNFFIDFKEAQDLEKFELKNYQNIAGNQILMLNSLDEKTPQLLSNKTLNFDQNNLQLLSEKLGILEINIFDKKWLFLPQKLPQNLDTILPNCDVLLWSGIDLDPHQLETIQPKVAIAFQKKVSQKMKRELKRLNIEYYSTIDNGAIQYQEKKGFIPYLMSQNMI